MEGSTDTSDVREGKPAVNKEILDGNMSGRRATSWAISSILFHILISAKMVEVIQWTSGTAGVFIPHVQSITAYELQSVLSSRMGHRLDFLLMFVRRRSNILVTL